MSSLSRASPFFIQKTTFSLNSRERESLLLGGTNLRCWNVYMRRGQIRIGFLTFISVWSVTRHSSVLRITKLPFHALLAVWSAFVSSVSFAYLRGTGLLLLRCFAWNLVKPYRDQVVYRLRSKCISTVFPLLTQFSSLPIPHRLVKGRISFLQRGSNRLPSRNEIG